jgi:hypothetical protein
MKEGFPTNVPLLVLHSMDCLTPFVRKENWPPRPVIIFFGTTMGGTELVRHPEQ